MVLGLYWMQRAGTLAVGSRYAQKMYKWAILTQIVTLVFMQAIAAQTGSKKPTFIDVSEPASPRETQVLCRTIQLGVCGTDRDILDSADPWVPEGESQLILGHECLGEVIAVGGSVTGFAPGDFVVPVVRRSTENEVERIDMAPFGAYTERGIAFEHGFSQALWLDEPRYLFKVPPSLCSLAVFTEPLSVAEKAISEAIAIQSGRLPKRWLERPPRVLVTGMGPIGFAAVVAARCRGWEVTMYGRDKPDTFRAEMAEQFSASYVKSEKFIAEPANLEEDGFDLILECTGSDDVVLKVAPAMATCGIMVWLGSVRSPRPKLQPVETLMRNVLVRNQILLGTVNAALRDFELAIEHLGQMQAEESEAMNALITARVAPRDALWHYENREPQGIKTVLMYD